MNPERANDARIDELEGRLAQVRSEPQGREAQAIREIGYEIAIAIREVGAMLVNVGWEQTYPSTRPQPEREESR